MTNYKRVFTFGCSFTQYWWPTWANIIATDLGIPAQNWGIGGVGNVAIQHRMVECDLKNTFTEDDLILVLWSSWAREDRLDDTGWNRYGNILNSEYHGEKFIAKFWSEENDTVKNATAIIAANKMFNIQYQAHWVDYQISLDDYDQVAPSSPFHLQYLMDALPTKNMMKCTNSKWNKLVDDHHPCVLAHLKYAEQISNEIGTKLNTSTIDLYTDAHNHVTSVIEDSKEKCKIEDIPRHFEEYFSEQRLLNNKTRNK